MIKRQINLTKIVDSVKTDFDFIHKPNMLSRVEKELSI